MSRGTPPVLVACAHGTRDPAGRREAALLRLRVQALRPGLEVVAASVDVQKPALPDVVAGLTAAGRRSVLVPLLLSAGYHVHVDVAEAVAAAGGACVPAAALGPDDALVEVLHDRLQAAGAGPADEVVLAAAGSSDTRAVADVEVVADGLRRARPAGRVTAAYLSAARPTVAEAVADALTRGRPVSIATYLLAPGFFSRRLEGLGAARVSEPLGADPRIAALVLRRYDEALAAAPGPFVPGVRAPW